MTASRRFDCALSTGVRLSYLDVGSGPTLLLLHGYPGTAETHLGGIIADLSRDHRIIAPDLRGYGASRPPNRDFPPDFYPRDAADAAALLDVLNTGPVTVIGFSDDGEASILLAAARPDLVRGVIAWGVCGIISAPQLRSSESRLPVTDWGPEQEERRQFIIRHHGAEQFPSMIEGWTEAARAIVANGGNICLEEAASVKAPTLLMNGANEINNPPEAAQELADRIAGAELLFIADSGHFIQDEQPHVLMSHIRGFLRKLEA